MSPQAHHEPNDRRAPAQRPWRPVEPDPRQTAHTTARSYRAAVVRELPPRRDYRAGLGTW